MKLSEILNAKGSDVYSIAPEATLAELAEALVEYNVGSLVVMHEHRMVGIITERDFLKSYAASKQDCATLYVSDFMTTNVTTGSPDDSAEDTMGLLTARRIRHLPIIDQAGSLVGLISIGDVVKAHHEQLSIENHYMKSYIQEVPAT